VPLAIHRVAQLDLKFRPSPWPFAVERRAEIDAHFARAQAEKPELWNGQVLLGRNPVFSDDRFSADYFQTDFASFLAWRDWGFPNSGIFNGFGMGALRGNDGAFVLGEMAAHTANGGRIYFPSGTPDPDDLRDGMVDIAGSVAREVEEETGLTPADYRAEQHWHCVASGALMAMIQVLNAPVTGEELRGRIEANLGKQRSPELAAVHLVRSARDFSPAMPGFVTAFIEARLSTGS
jgi:8-oxo-dGTP pyrophosphatase MutT (NUDIX family)